MVKWHLKSWSHCCLPQSLFGIYIWPIKLTTSNHKYPPFWNSLMEFLHWLCGVHVIIVTMLKILTGKQYSYRWSHKCTLVFLVSRYSHCCVFFGFIYSSCRMYMLSLCLQWRCRHNTTMNTWRLSQNCSHFAADYFKYIFFNENVWIPIQIALKFVSMGSISNIAAWVQIMAWRRPGDKPLSETIMVRLPTHLCVTRLQWVNASVRTVLSADSSTFPKILGSCAWMCCCWPKRMIQNASDLEIFCQTGRIQMYFRYSLAWTFFVLCHVDQNHGYQIRQHRHHHHQTTSSTNWRRIGDDVTMVTKKHQPLR